MVGENDTGKLQGLPVGIEKAGATKVGRLTQLLAIHPTSAEELVKPWLLKIKNRNYLCLHYLSFSYSVAIRYSLAVLLHMTKNPPIQGGIIIFTLISGKIMIYFCTPGLQTVTRDCGKKQFL